MRVFELEAGFDTAALASAVQLQVTETGGVGTFTATVNGKLFLRTDGALASGDYASQVSAYNSLLDELRTRLNGDGTDGYSVTFDVETERITIAHDGGGGVTAIALLPLNAVTRQVLGFGSIEVSGALSHTARAAPYYWIRGTVGYWSKSPGETEAGAQNVAVDVEAHDGTPRSVARSTVPTFFPLTVPLEPAAKVRRRFAPVGTPWTWQHFFAHVRSVAPFVVNDGRDTHFMRLRAEGALFDPRLRDVDYHDHVDIRLDNRKLAGIEYLFRYAKETSVEPVSDGVTTLDGGDVPAEFLVSGFTFDMRWDFASTAIRNESVFRFADATTPSLRIRNVASAFSRLDIQTTGLLYGSGNITHAAGLRVRITVDWAAGTATVVDLATGDVLASIAGMVGDWSAVDGSDLYVGHSGSADLFPGLIGAPRALP